MSPSDTALHGAQNFRIKVTLPQTSHLVDPGAMETQATVYDGRNRIVAEGLNWVSAALSDGLYTVRTERFGVMQEQVFLHRGQTDREIEMPLRRSAMPATDTRDTHEFYQGTGVHYSQNSTWDNPAATGRDRRLMIMIRGSGSKKYTDAELAKNLALFDESGQTITRFAKAETARDPEDGWLVFSARLRPGNYMLVQSGHDASLVQPILLHERWNTLLFVPYEKRSNIVNASLDLVEKSNTFRPDDVLVQQIDAALQGLGDRLDLLPGDLRQMALYGKFDHPLVGLIGAHAYFMQGKMTERLEENVLRNLWSLLRGSPDVIALLILAAERSPQGLPASVEGLKSLAQDAFGDEVRLPLAFPPILRPGLNAIIRASASIPDLIRPGSWLDAASVSSFASGVWAIWDQAPLEKPASVASPLSRAQRLVPHADVPEWLIKLVEEKKDVETYLDARQLAKTAGVPLRHVESALQSVSDASAKFKRNIRSSRATHSEGSMKKSQLVDALAGATGQSKATVEAVLDALPGVLLSGMAGDAVTLPGVAKFAARHRAERNVRNPATGASMVSPATTIASIKPVKPFKEAVAKLRR